MGKRQENAVETRNRLIEAARALRQEKTFDDILIEDITEKAGVAKGTFYTYFKRKEEIFCELAFASFEAIKEKLADSSKSAVERIAKYLSLSMEVIIADGLEVAQQWMKNAMAPMGEDSQAMRKYCYDMEYLTGCLERGTEAGEFSGIPIKETAEQIMTQYYGIVAVWCLTDGRLEAQKQMDSFCRDILKAIIK